MKFKDQTSTAGISKGSGWKTGVTLVDINQDGWLIFMFAIRVMEMRPLGEIGYILIKKLPICRKSLSVWSRPTNKLYSSFIF
jgi:hypothetical protein